MIAATVPNEIDSKLIPAILQKSFVISLGCMHKTVEMIRNPSQAFETLTAEVKTLTTPPADAGEGFAPKAQALASAWLTRGLSVVAECRIAGEKFIG